MPNEQILPDVQRECEVRMNSDPFFRCITVLNHRKGDITAEMLAALAGIAPKNGRGGVCVAILQPVANVMNNSVRFSQVEMMFAILILEYPLYNDDPDRGTGIRGETIIQRIADLFGCFHPVAVTTPFICDKPFAIPRKDPLPLGAEGEYLLPNSWECRFTTHSSRDRGLQQPAIPTIQITEDDVRITCGTGAVDIYYTLDGSPPGPPAVSPTSLRYEAPFTPAYSCPIRAVAMRQQQGYSWTPSDIAWADWDVEFSDNQHTPIDAQAPGGESIAV